MPDGSITLDDFRNAPDLETLTERLAARDMTPGWIPRETPILWREPESGYTVAHWRWDECKAAMDGAAKFVRGDAIAGLLITSINIIGGMIIGVGQQNLTMAQAAETYTLLTVGDGLVTQIPAIIVSTAARSSCRPISACRIRLLPSKRNGRVTIATQRDPCSRAI